ncbi:hypothetical protein K458DRAFT_418722 [Lentithecium fluviatile CBS 122367]|uniref:Pentacotripeptide-repeat region of PRORP domain-containing protein n=1 Tax=Lentithecium fluviatile CBS 122367 TaxID=1168545 RepID=A0A6G1J0M7_9PLEO|nr:hypothetical protein K458DRAFT_418722 [Lentithecium fluviatile CBS 122367]
MIRSYICRQCRSRLWQRASSPRHPQWQSKAAFVTFRSVKPPAAPETQTQTQTTPGEAKNEGDKGDTPQSRDEDGPPPIRRVDPGQPAHVGRYSGRAYNADADAHEHADADASQSRQEDPLAPETATLSPARSIEEALSRKKAKKAWELFIQHYPSRTCPAFESPPFSDIPLLSGDKIFSRLLDGLNTAFCNFAAFEVTPTQALFRYQQLGIEDRLMWYHTIGYLTDQVLWSICDSRPEDGPKRGTKALLEELLSVWQLFFQCKGEAPDPLHGISPEWPHIPDLLSLRQILHGEGKFSRRLEKFHPKISSSPNLQFSAITIFNLFDEVNQESFQVSESLKNESAPFIRLVTAALAGSRLIESALLHTKYSLSFKNLPKNFQAAVLNQVNSAPIHALNKIGVRHWKRDGEEESDGKELSDAEKAENLESFYISQILNAVMHQSHVGRVETLWETIKVAYRGPDQKTAIPLRVYNSLLEGFMRLRHSEYTVIVWNHMIASSVKPDVSTWNAMLEGCKLAQDFEGFNAVWERMLKTGTNPDVYLWTNRIHGLVTFRQISMAFAAMDEMGKKWLAAENAIKNPPKPRKGNTPHPPALKANPFAKPSIETINGAISAVAGWREGRGMRYEQKLEYMQKVLQWAGNFGVQPNTRTYNILIQLYLSAGDYPTTFKLLRQMEREGLEGNIHTHTMLIQAAFDNQKFDGISKSEQADRILTLFSELEAGGLNLNDRVYSIIVDRLLKFYGNVSAARTVIDHMVSRKVVLEPHIYTSFISHYFSQSPPDIAAVDSLLLHIFSGPGAHTDKLFFDRVLEGYAKVGETGKMMSILARMSNHGKLPSLRALTHVVRALIEAGEWETARLIVRDVQKGEGVAKYGATGGKVQEARFFDMVRELGGNLLQPLAGEHFTAGARLRTAKPLGVGDRAEEMVGGEPQAADERIVGGVREDREVMMRPEAEAEADDEFVHAEHANYLSDEHEEHERQEWKRDDNGSVGGIPL